MVLERVNSKFAKYCYVPQRFILVIMGSLAIVNAYTMRISLSMAITEMVPVVNQSNVPGACPAGNTTLSRQLKNTLVTYEWTERQQGTILSSFYYGYILSHIPGGILAEKYGGKHVLGTGILLTALFTLITPSVIHASGGNIGALIVIRVIMGIGEGPTYPALNAILAQWIPLRERSLCGAIVFAGAQLGTVISNLGSGALITYFENWEVTFYVFGTIGVFWWLSWIFFCYSTPDYSPFMGEKEALYLHHELDQHVNHLKKKEPFKKILTSLPVWALIIASFGHDWGWFVMVSDLPKYMKDVLKFDIKQNGILTSIPYILMWLCAVFTGRLCDWMIDTGRIRITLARKIFTVIGAMGPGIFMVAAVYTKCDRYTAVGMFTIAMGLMGTYYSGMKVNAIDLSPNYSGTLMALANGLGCIAGMIAPTLIGFIVTHHSFSEWEAVFWIAFAIFAATSIVYIIFASGEEQEWNALAMHPEHVEEHQDHKDEDQE